jgi:hypothetical protein
LYPKDPTMWHHQCNVHCPGVGCWP